MADVFVSYSRRDGEFVKRLSDSLAACGKEVWVDTAGIRDAEVFPDALRAAVEGSDGLLFVISPDSVASQFCEQEVNHAIELNKRIVPVVLKKVPDERLPDAVRVRNWIPLGEGDDFDAGVDRIVQALDTDLAWTKEHTSWLLKALEWDGRGRERSFLLRGAELADAERWLADAAGKDPEPTQLHTEYILASRVAATRRQRTVAGVSLGVAVVALALLVFALISRQSAVSASATSKARALAAESENQQSVDPTLSVLLATQAVKTKATPDALFALRAALDASPLLAQLPPAGAQSCTPPVGGPDFAYSPDGSRLVEGLCDGTVYAFDARTHRLVGQNRVSGGTGALAFDPSGSLLAVGTAQGVQLLDGHTLAPHSELHAPAAVNALEFSPSGSRLAATTQDQANNSALVVWTVPGGAARTIARAAFNPLFGANGLRHVAFTRSGGALIVGGAPGVRVYDVASGTLVRTLPGTQVADDIALSPNGRTLAVSVLPYNESQLSITPLPVASTTTEPDVVALYSVAGWRPLGDLASVTGIELPTVAFSPDGSSVAVGGADGKAGLWSVGHRNELVAFPGAKAAIGDIAFAPDSRQLVTGAVDGTASVWRAGGFESVLADPHDAITYGAFGPTRLVWTDATGVRQLTWPGLKPLAPLRLLSPGAPPGSEGGQLSGDGTLADWNTQSGIQIWSVTQRRLIRSVPTGPAPALNFSRDDRRLAYFSPVSPMRIIDLATGDTLRLAGAQPACAAGWRWTAFSPDDRFVAAATLCGQIVVWNTVTGRRVAQLTSKVEVSLIDFSRDDRHVAIGGQDGNVYVWDVGSRQPGHVLVGPTSSIGVVQFSPDGSLVAASSFDGNAYIWDAASGRLLRVLPHSLTVGFSPDGRLIATTDQYNVYRVWDVCPACGNAKALLKMARSRVTRQLTPQERATFEGSA